MTKHSNPIPLKLFAAGSLRDVVVLLIKTFRDKTGIPVEVELGPSGALRSRIEAGESVDLFASADLKHPNRLVKKDLAETVIPYICNDVVLFGHFDPPGSIAELLRLLLDPEMRLGTSTPIVDPGGDYVWQVFKNLETIRPGAFEALAAKALQLVGGKDFKTKPGEFPVTDLFTKKQVDGFLGYATTANQVKKVFPAITIYRLPNQIAVRPTYGMTALSSSRPETNQLLQFIISNQGRAIFQKYGFLSVGIRSLLDTIMLE